MDFQTVLTEVDAWPVGGRIRLVNEVWDRLVEQGHEPELSDETRAELDRRLAEDEAAPDDAVSWGKSKPKLSLGLPQHLEIPSLTNGCRRSIDARDPDANS